MRFRKFNHYIYNTHNNIFILPLTSLSLLTLLIVNFVLPSNSFDGITYAADTNNPNKTTPSASLTVSNSGAQEINVQPNSGTIYSSHKVTIDSVNITNYTLSISGPATLSSVSSKTTISGAGGSSGASMSDNTWGYNYNISGITSESAFPTSAYSSFSGSTQTLESANGSPSSIERSLVLAAKFGDTAEPGHYTGQVNLSLTAVPKVLTTYTITYNANSGSGAPSNWSDSSYDDSYTTNISSTTPTRSGYAFLGWNTSSTATSANSDYAAGKSITLQSSSPTLNLYAIWQSNGYAYSVIYNCNNGTGCPTSSSGIGTSYSISSTLPTRSGYDFLGWSTTSTSNTTTATANATYGPGKTVTISADTTTNLYAVWRTPVSTSSGFSTITYMQDMTSAICNNATKGATKTLTDKRDNNTYTVTKLADGKCWMTQNLRLAGGTKLTSADSNVSSSGLTLPVSTSKFVREHLLLQVANYTNYDYGAHYSFSAAVAGSIEITAGTATYDICPLGWRLPTGGNNGEFQALLASLGINDDAAGAKIIKSAPNNFVLAGTIFTGTSGGIGLEGSVGKYWSSRVNYYSGYDLDISSSTSATGYGVNGTGQYTRSEGLSVRCVAK